MLETIGVDEVDELFEQMPPGVRLGRELDLEPPLSELELVDAPFRARGPQRRHRPRAVVPRRRHLRPLRPGDRGHGALTRRAADGLHAVPARGQPGSAPGDLRVPDGDLRVDRHGRVERVRVRRHDSRGRRLLPREARDRALQGRARRDAQPAGAPGREDVRAGLRARGGRGAARRRGYRPGPARRRLGGRRRRRSSSSRTSSAASSRRRSLPPPRPMPARCRSRTSTRCRSASSRRPATTAARSRSARARARATTSRSAGRTTASSRRASDLIRRMPGRIVGETTDVQGQPRLRSDAADARAAHPPREGDVEHHDEPDAARARWARLPQLAGPTGPARGGGDLHGPRRSTRRTDSGFRSAFPDQATFKEFAIRRRTARTRGHRRSARSAA